MKKLHLLVGVFIFIGCLQVHAEKSRVAMEKWQTCNVVGSTTVCRSPMRNSIDVYYDDELRQIEISSDVGVEVQLFLCDINGNTLDYSHCINTVIRSIRSSVTARRLPIPTTSSVNVCR